MVFRSGQTIQLTDFVLEDQHLGEIMKYGQVTA